MPWQERLREAAYTSPLGARIVFDYEDVSREIPLRNTEFQFPGVDGSYIQTNGHDGGRYPLRCYFSGNNYDIAALNFEEALLDRGVGRLEHPLYGTKDVVPFGTIGRRDDLKTAANQAVIEVTFVATVGAVWPSGQGSPASEIVGTLDLFNLAAADQFAESTSLRTAVDKSNVKATVRTALKGISASLSAAASATADVKRAFDEGVEAVNLGIDVLIGQPVLLAQQICNLVQAPARATSGIRSRLDGYAALLTRVLASAAASGAQDASSIAGIKQRLSNDFHTSDLTALSAVSGAVLAVVESEFTTRPEAIAAAIAVNNMLDAVVAWRESRYDGLSEIDAGGSYQALQQAVALVTGYLVEVSFTLATERSIVLDRPRTIIDLAAELYGSVDDKLDFLITSNGLSGQEILEVPRGRQIVWYADA
jgi:prophage DNA circulation protein